MIGIFFRLCVFLLASMSLMGCMQRMVMPESADASMAIIEPIISGKMRVGLSFNSYSYHENPSVVQFGNNQNRLACADMKNVKTGEVSAPHGFAGATQCYYPNLAAGTYTMMDYPLRYPGETYTVLLAKLHNTLMFGDQQIKFSISKGEVKHVGKFVIHMRDDGSQLKVKSIEKLDASKSVDRAGQELARTKTEWRL